MIESRDIWKRVAASLLLFAVLAEMGQATLAQPVENPALQRELLMMFEADQALRQELVEHGIANVDSSYVARQDSLDDLHAQRLTEIVEQHGWPTPQLVGLDAASAALTLLQHADVAVQERMLPLVQASFERGEIPGHAVATLVDRVRVRQERAQLYGTQAYISGGKLRVEPIADSAAVDARRAEVGLPPLREYLEELKQFYKVEEQNE